MSPSSLIVRLPFDEGSGATASDVTGHGHDARVYGTWSASGKSGSAVRLVPGQSVLADDQSALRAQQFTISAWLRPTVQFSAMTGQSLFYMGEADLAHKVLAIAEEEGAERAAYALKLLQSEGELSIASSAIIPATAKSVQRKTDGAKPRLPRENRLSNENPANNAPGSSHNSSQRTGTRSEAKPGQESKAKR